MTVLSAEESGFHAPMFAVVTDTGAWRSAWNQAWAGTSTQRPPLPNVDFVLASVLVIGLGDRSGRGYSVKIDSIVSYTASQILFATAVQPQSPCPGGPLSTAPLHMVEVPGHPPNLTYQLLTVRRPCPPE